MAKRARKTLAPEEEAQVQILENLGEDVTVDDDAPEPQKLYEIYEGSRIPVSKAVGKAHHARFNAGVVAFEKTWDAWEEAFRYYNHNQTKDNTTPRGFFKRGDTTENIVYANVNTQLPAIYARNPDVTCTTVTKEQEPFCKTMELLLNALIRRKAAPGINLKPKARRQALFAELTNFGILKLDFTGKDESREEAVKEMESLLSEYENAKTIEEVEQITGKLQSLESSIEIREPSGFKVTNVMPHNLVIDPNAEQEDGLDSEFMCEVAFLSTEMLNQRYAKEGKDGEKDRVLRYKSTHRASFTYDDGEREDGLGPVMQSLPLDASTPTSHSDDERLSYQYTYFTEVVFYWEKATRRVFLYSKDDWKWPIWVWDDPLKLSRFFPYYILQFSLSTGSTVSPGVTSYYLDQQDAVNDINRQVSLWRRRLFDYYFYNSNVIDKTEAEKMWAAMDGRGTSKRTLVGVKLDPEQRGEDVFFPVGLPNKDYSQLLDKGDAYQSADRINATSDALRGVQFKANTTEDAVQAYTDATRVRIGAKTDAIEDCLADLAYSMAEIAVQRLSKDQVAALIGSSNAEAWKEMDVATFNATYNVELVVGSVEKPTSIFKKKEAVEVGQVIGQFAKATPMAIVVALRVLEQAFTEVVIKPEDWKAIEQSLQQGLTKPMGPEGETEQNYDKQAYQKLPPEVKQQVLDMRKQGASPEQIKEFLDQAVTENSNAPDQGQQQQSQQ